MKRDLPSWAWALAAFVLLLLFNLAFTPGFAHVEIRDGRLFGSLVDVANRAAPTLLLAIGMTLVIGTGGVDLSVGAVMAIAGTVAACLVARPTNCPLNAIPTGKSVPAVAGFAGLAGLLCGLFNGFLVAVVEIQPIVATLLLMVAGRGVAQLLSSGQIITFDSPQLAFVGSGSLLYLPTPVWISLSVLLLVAVLARRTAFGLFVEATGSNLVAARFAGIDSRGIKLIVYAVSGVCAAIAGLIVAADIKAADANNAGLYMELDAILAVSVGGTALTGGRFSLVGTLLGALLMQSVTTTILTRGVAPEIALIVKSAIVVVVCVLQSSVVQSEIARRRMARGAA